MTRKQHADIFNTYLCRLSLSQFRKIAEQYESCWHSALHHGISAQIEEQTKLDAVILAAFENMLDHDIENIERINRHA